MIDLTSTDAPANLRVTQESNSQVSLAWDSVQAQLAITSTAVRSVEAVVKVNASPLTVTDFTDTGLRNAQPYYYVVTAWTMPAMRAPIRTSPGAPRLTIGWANLQWPPT